MKRIKIGDNVKVDCLDAKFSEVKTEASTETDAGGFVLPWK